MIRLLDEKTINQIAAGEVVERPVSVVKELVENAIDAGSTSIEIEMMEGGTSYLRISDNGAGMSEEDARLAVLRHATSKIQKVEDLYDIASLGFRGEALASIASVSHFTLTTREATSEMGTKITIDGGNMADVSPIGASPGTTVEVADLFFNTPARRKFLKTTRTEGSKIQDMIGKLALSNPQIAFKLIADGKISLMTPGSGDMKETVAALYGYEVSDDVFPVAYEAENIVVEGVVGKPSLLKSSRIWQTIIVNHRVISDKAILKAIDNAYHALLPKGGHPLVILHIIVPPHTVDINVHPRKSEVKFADDKPVFKAVYHGILNALENTEGKSREIATAIAYDKVFSGPSKGYEVLGPESDVMRGHVIFPTEAGFPPTEAGLPPTGASVTPTDSVTGPRGEGLGKAPQEQLTWAEAQRKVNKDKTLDFVNSLREQGYKAPVRPTYTQMTLDEVMDQQDNQLAPPLTGKTYDEAQSTRFMHPEESVFPHEGGTSANTGCKSSNFQSASFGSSNLQPANFRSSNLQPSVANEGNPMDDYPLDNLAPVSPAVVSDERAIWRNEEPKYLEVLGQVANCYIIAKKGEDLYLIDQHAAHERVRYDKLCASSEAIPMEDLLMPIYMDASSDEIDLVVEEENTFLDLGFALTQGGPSQIRIDSLPIDIKTGKVEEVLRYVLSYLKEQQTPTKAQLRHEMLAYASCRGAIKAGHRLNETQMYHLIDELFRTEKPYVCPHGRPTIIKFTPDELGKLFLRS